MIQGAMEQDVKNTNIMARGPLVYGENRKLYKNKR